MNIKLLDFINTATVNKYSDREYFETDFFANLIIQECIKIANTYSSETSCSDSLIVSKIKERFGV